MARLKDEQMQEAVQNHLRAGETLEYVAFGVKQPNIGLIILLMLLGILPGIIATFLLTKNYILALTNQRFIALQVKSMSNAEVKSILEYDLNKLPPLKTKKGNIFTTFKISDSEKPFSAKCHRAFSKTNRENSVAISQALLSKMSA